MELDEVRRLIDLQRSITLLLQEAQTLMDTLAMFADIENWHSEWDSNEGMIHYWVETDGKPWEIAQTAINNLRQGEAKL